MFQSLTFPKVRRARAAVIAACGLPSASAQSTAGIDVAVYSFFSSLYVTITMMCLIYLIFAVAFDTSDGTIVQRIRFHIRSVFLAILRLAGKVMIILADIIDPQSSIYHVEATSRCDLSEWYEEKDR